MNVAALTDRFRSARNVLAAGAVGTAMIAAAALQAGSAQALTVTKSPTARQYASAMLNQINQQRSAHHLRPLTMNTHLLTSAYNHNSRQAKQNVMSHQLPSEPALSTRISNAGYHWSTAGENVAWNSQRTLAGVRALETTMYNEKAPNNGHRVNILSTKFTNVGIDVYFDNVHHKMWITQDFGRPSN